MKAWIVMAAALCAAACSPKSKVPEGPFDAQRDAQAAIECYTAFIQRALGNVQYDLRLTPDEVKLHQTAGGTDKGWRLQPYFDAAQREVGEARAVEIAQAYMFPLQAEIRKETTVEGRRAAFERLVVEKTRACHGLMDGWRAPRG